MTETTDTTSRTVLRPCGHVITADKLDELRLGKGLT